MKCDVVLNSWMGMTSVNIIRHGKGTNMRFFLGVPYRTIVRDWGRKGKYHNPIGYVVAIDDHQVERFMKQFGEMIAGERVHKNI
jgi:hypothetical protein